jgi:AhpD family alkylhydroperoxidase
MTRYEQFQAFRSKMNCRILGEDAQRGGKQGGTLNTKRFFTLDGKTYEAGALSAKTKELLGLVASMVLRCDDCIAYHIDQCVKAGVTDEELWETFDVALIVGGSIVIPHLRRGVEFLDEARQHSAAAPACASHPA